MKRFIIYLILLLPFFSYSQEFVLSKILIPGEEKISEQKAILISENIIGPKRVFLTAQYLMKKEVGENSSGEVDQLQTSYSGLIYSPGIIEPFQFDNINPDDLRMLDIVVYPVYLEQPYSLYLDLTIKYSSKSINSSQSDDAGVYNTNLIIKLNELN